MSTISDRPENTFIRTSSSMTPKKITCSVNLVLFQLSAYLNNRTHPPLVSGVTDHAKCYKNARRGFNGHWTEWRVCSCLYLVMHIKREAISITSGQFSLLKIFLIKGTKKKTILKLVAWPVLSDFPLKKSLKRSTLPFCTVDLFGQ